MHGTWKGRKRITLACRPDAQLLHYSHCVVQRRACFSPTSPETLARALTGDLARSPQSPCLSQYQVLWPPPTSCRRVLPRIPGQWHASRSWPIGDHLLMPRGLSAPRPSPTACPRTSPPSPALLDATSCFRATSPKTRALPYGTASSFPPASWALDGGFFPMRQLRIPSHFPRALWCPRARPPLAQSRSCLPILGGKALLAS